MVFILREEKEGDKENLVITFEGRAMWKEPLYFEYYERFIEIGKLLKFKYGWKMVDFVPEVNGYNLYGDRISSLQMVKDFRKSLKSNQS